MATHSSILAWRILWPEEASGLQSRSRTESDTTEVTWHTAIVIDKHETTISQASGLKMLKIPAL